MKEYVEVMYNKKYGGFGYSEKAVQMYCEETGKDPMTIERTDPAMIAIVKRLGPEANGKYANIAIARVPKQFEKSIGFGEYDGYEAVKIDYDAHILQSIREIVEDAEDEKLQRISHVLNMEWEEGVSDLLLGQ